jgi:hypothetical protein
MGKTLLPVVCANSKCGITFYDTPYNIKKGRKYCGRKCSATSEERRKKVKVLLLGRHHTEATKQKIRDSNKKIAIEKMKLKKFDNPIENKNFRDIFPIPYEPSAILKEELSKKNNRFFDCENYGKCLDIAIKRGWLGFSCSKCLAFKKLKVA